MNRKNFEELIELARNAYDQGQLNEAVDYLIMAERLNTTSDLLIDIALIYDELKKYDKAKEYYLKVLSFDEFNARAYYGLGTVYDNLDKNDQAIAHYKEAIRLDKTYYPAHFFVANLYDEAGETNLAIYHYEKTIEINPFHFYAYLNLGAIYESQNQDDVALELFLKAQEINDNHHLLHFNFGVVYKKMGEINKSIDHYLKSLSISFKHPFTFLNLAILYKDELHDLNKAINTYTMGIVNHPNQAVLYYNRACAYALVESYEKAMQDLVQSIELDPGLYEYMQTDEELEKLRELDLYKKTFINN